MKTKLMIAVSTLMLAGPAFAQEPLEKSGTAPTTTQNAPAPSPATPEPLDNAGTAPAGQAAQTTPAPSATEPLDKAGTAGQQTATSPDVGLIVVSELRESEDDNKMVGPLSATVDQVEDMDIFDANGKKIGEVDAVLEDKAGNIKGVAVEYGGFLGIGSKGAVITFDRMKTKDGNIVVDLTEDDLTGLPAWND
jgi:sporulation protein YlmC with PRC-barrel domain